jgi:hypothetical protein
LQPNPERLSGLKIQWIRRFTLHLEFSDKVQFMAQPGLAQIEAQGSIKSRRWHPDPTASSKPQLESCLRSEPTSDLRNAPGRIRWRHWNHGHLGTLQHHLLDQDGRRRQRIAIGLDVRKGLQQAVTDQLTTGPTIVHGADDQQTGLAVTW